MSLSPAAKIVLTRAAERPDHRLEFHRKLPAGGRNKMIDALLREGLIVETLGDYRLGDASTLIEDTATGLMLTTLALTDAGFRAIDREPLAGAAQADTAPRAGTAGEAAHEAAPAAEAPQAARLAPAPRTTLRDTAALVLAAWDDEDSRETDIIAALEGPIETLRASLADRTPRRTNAAAPRKPREGTKQQAVLGLLRRAEGTTVIQIAETTGWATHTVRGFLAGLKKKGFTIETLERVRMAGPGKAGAKGSYSIYRIQDAA
jgi:hypothetical protein